MTVRYYSSTAAETTLASPISSTAATSMVVNSVAGWPYGDGYPFTLILDPDTASEEVVDVTNVSGTTVTITRGVDGTTAKTHALGAVVKHGVTARDFKNSRDHENASTNVHGLSAGVAVVGDTATQTLTNKTISGSANTINNVAKTSITGTAVTLADTGTVTSTMITDGTIVNGDINASAGIDATKIANGLVTNAEFQYLDGVTSAIQTQLNAKAPTDSPTLTGTPASTTAVADTSTTQIATTAFVVGQAATSTSPMDGTAATGTSLKYARQDHVHPTDTSRAPVASPTFTTSATAPIFNATTKFQVNGTDVTGLTGAWSSWTPTITGWGTSNYTIDSKYIQIGKTVHFTFIMSVTGANTGGTTLTFTLPVTARVANNSVTTTSLVSGGSQFVGTSRNATTSAMSVFSLNVTGSSINTAVLTATAPATWASGDAVRVTGTYEAA